MIQIADHSQDYPFYTSQKIRELVDHLLNKNPEKRPSCNEILRLPFIIESIKSLILDFKTNIDIMHQFYSLSKLFPDIYSLEKILSHVELEQIEFSVNGQNNILLKDVKITQNQIDSLFQKPFIKSNITLPKGIAVSNFILIDQLGIFVLGQINDKGYIYKVLTENQNKVEKIVELPCVCYANAIIRENLILSGETQVLIYTVDNFKLVRSIDV